MEVNTTLMWPPKITLHFIWTIPSLYITAMKSSLLIIMQMSNENRNKLQKKIRFSNPTDLKEFPFDVISSTSILPLFVIKESFATPKTSLISLFFHVPAAFSCMHISMNPEKVQMKRQLLNNEREKKCNRKSVDTSFGYSGCFFSRKKGKEREYNEHCICKTPF